MIPTTPPPFSRTSSSNGSASSPSSSSPSSSSSTFLSPPSSASSFAYSSSSSSSSQYALNQAKRKQVKNACVNCQKACKKCDDKRPCSRCVKYGIEDGCINSQRKERKRKSETVSPSNTRIQLNLTSRRLRTTSGSVADGTDGNESPSYSPYYSSSQLRLSSRNGIRPFPKELLDSLQDEHDNTDTGQTEQTEQAEQVDHRSASAPPAPVTRLLTPQITEEFKTLARICSDLHTVMSQPTIPQQRINPFNRHTPMHPTHSNSYSNNQMHIHPSHHKPHFHSYAQYYNHPIQIQPMSRPSSPTELLLKPTSPIYSSIHTQLESQVQIQHPQLSSYLQYYSQVQARVQAQSQDQDHCLSTRDFMNRTPPEEFSHDKIN